jgi:hypothetical protein
MHINPTRHSSCMMVTCLIQALETISSPIYLISKWNPLLHRDKLQMLLLMRKGKSKGISLKPLGIGKNSFRFWNLKIYSKTIKVFSKIKILSINQILEVNTMTIIPLRIKTKKQKIRLYKKKQAQHFMLAQRMILNQILDNILFSKNSQLMEMEIIKIWKIDMKKNQIIDWNLESWILGNFHKILKILY